MNDNNHSADKNLILSAGHSLTTVRSDLVKRGLALLSATTKIVLMVDNDQELLLSLKDGFKNYNKIFSVILAYDGQVAIDLLKKHPITLVITDLNRPKPNGFELTAYIKKEYPYIPVIMMTGGGFRPENEKRAYELGVMEFIEKPFMVDDLAKIIIATLEKKALNF